MHRWLRGALRALVWAAAAGLVVLIAAAAVLGTAGAVSGRQWRGALDVLRGSSEAVPKTELRKRDEEIRRLREVERTKEPSLIRGWRELEADRREFAARRKRESDTLREFAAKAREDLRRAQAARAALIDDRRELERRASAKIMRLYRHMRPEEVVRDLEERLKRDAEGRGVEEVAAIIAGMSERTAVDVLEEIGDPGRRAEIYEAMAGLRRSRRAGATESPAGRRGGPE